MQRKLIAVAAVLAVAGLASAPPAGANWGKEGKCTGKASPENKHCYAVAYQEVGATYKSEALVNEEETTNMTVPRSPSGYESFVTNEAWTSFGSEVWIETGQIGGVTSETSINPFMAAYLGKAEFVINYVDTEISLAKNTWYYYWDADVNPTSGLWCVYWFEPTFKEAYEKGPVHCEEKWTRYDSGSLEAGLEAGTYYEPEADGNQIVATATAPHSPFEYFVPWTAGHVKKFFGPAGTCGKNNPYWTTYPGSITFGAGTGVCGGKEGELASVAPSQPEVANGWAIHAPASTGPKISLSRVRQIATEHAHAPTGTLSISEGNVSEAENAFPAETGYSPVTKDNETWLGRQAYLVTMRGAFTYEGPRPPKSASFTSPYAAFVIDAHTGDIEAQYYGKTAPGTAGVVTTMAEE